MDRAAVSGQLRGVARTRLGHRCSRSGIVTPYGGAGSGERRSAPAPSSTSAGA
jgi:hypothetical protein